MKPALRKVFTLLLCLSLCLLLAPAALAEDAQGLPADTSGQELFPVRFYNEKGYDLIGLQVTDAVGHALDPSSREDGWTYLLAPGAYSYAYHDDRGIFFDLDETGFTVDGAAEISLTLSVSFEDVYYTGWIINPSSGFVADETAILDAMPTREEVIDAFVARLLAESEAGTDGLYSSDVFYADSSGDSSAAKMLRNAMVRREKDCEITFYSNTMWVDEDFDTAFYNTLLDAYRHTGNHWEGDTLSKATTSAAYSATGQYYNGQYQYNFTFTTLYLTNAAQEQSAASAVENLVYSLGLAGKSDYEKVLAIHQWLYQNVNYDDIHDDSYDLKYSDYAALINHYAVCQGYSTAFYRLCLAADLDARYVSSIIMNHGWNIVKVGGKYYELDATWDANRREGGSADLPYFFLRGSDWWLANHTLDGNPYSTEGDQFHHDSYQLVDANYELARMTLLGQYEEFDNYILSATDYDPSAAGIAVDSVNFPDETFRAYVSANCDTDGNGYLSTEEIAAVTTIDVAYRAQWNQWEEIPGDYDWVLPEAESFNTSAPYPADDISSASGVSSTLTEAESFGAATVGSITSLKGIEFFTALQKLYCYGNQITALDLSRNTELDTLACGLRIDDVNYGNKLSSLNVSNNKKLRYFACDGNLLKTLDLRGNTDLEMLQCIGNELESLIINNSPNLSWLYCWDNKLTSLDISGNPNLEYLDCGINALKRLPAAANTKLKVLECYDNAITALNIAGNTELLYLGCQKNQLTTLDVRNHNALAELSCSFNNLNSLLLSGCGSLKHLYCSDNNLSRLDVTGCTALTELDCSGNALQSLDISKNTMLQMLWCCDNNLYDLDVSQNSELQRLWCSDNKLSDLDVSQNSELLLLSCYNNSLSRLDVTGNTALRGIACQNNGLKALNISPCGVLTQLITDVNPEIEDGVVMYMDNTESDNFRWLLYDEVALLITPDMVPGFVLPAALTRIEDGAFADVPNLITVYIPSTVTYINPNAFGAADELYIFGQTGSAAESFAQKSSAYTFIPAA